MLNLPPDDKHGIYFSLTRACWCRAGVLCACLCTPCLLFLAEGRTPMAGFFLAEAMGFAILAGWACSGWWLADWVDLTGVSGLCVTVFLLVCGLAAAVALPFVGR
jgi:hypothetical protein